MHIYVTTLAFSCQHTIILQYPTYSMEVRLPPPAVLCGRISRDGKGSTPIYGSTVFVALSINKHEDYSANAIERRSLLAISMLHESVVVVVVVGGGGGGGLHFVSDTVAVEVQVTNASSVDGTEVVHPYVNDNIASVDIPNRKLKGSKKVFIKAGPTVQDLGLWNEKMQYAVEPGAFTI